jgi:lipoprotein-anchoring transpeptidase ErfK/SrfK
LEIRFNMGSRSLPVLVGVVAVGVGLWGGYAWRATRPSPTQANDSSAEQADVTAAVTPLRATLDRPPADQAPSQRLSEIIKKIEAENTARTPAADEPAEATAWTRQAPSPGSVRVSSVRANAPPSSDAGTEMTIGHRETAGLRRAASPSAVTRMELGRSAQSRGDLFEARTLLSSALLDGLPPQEEYTIRAELIRLADALLFSRAANTNDPLTSTETIAAGDTLNAIASRYRITEELLARINQIEEPNLLAVGRRIKVIRGPFRATIDKSDHRMDVFLGDALVRSFAVGLGQNGNTPTGEWIVNNKLRNPSWTDPETHRHYLADDPDNPIGERWIGLSGSAGEALGKVGFGIHGTIDPTSIGQNKSMGCIRLSTEDVNQAYDLLVLRHSTVEIRP